MIGHGYHNSIRIFSVHTDGNIRILITVLDSIIHKIDYDLYDKVRICHNGDYLVIHLGIQHVRHEARADALYLVRPRRALREHRGARRLDRDDLNVRIFALQILAHAGDGAAGADACDENIDLAAEFSVDFGDEEAGDGTDDD